MKNIFTYNDTAVEFWNANAISGLTSIIIFFSVVTLAFLLSTWPLTQFAN